MKRFLFIFILTLIIIQPVFALERECAKNSIAIYGAFGQPEYWAYPVTVDSKSAVHLPMEHTFVVGFGFDLGWGLSESVDMMAGFNQFLRSPVGSIEVEEGGETVLKEGPDTLAVTPIYINLRYKTPFQLYVGCGLNWAVIRMTDNEIPYAESGGPGFQAFAGLEMRGTSGAAMAYGLYGEAGYCHMTGFTNDIIDNSLVKITQNSAGLYFRAGVRKYF